ncbi:hypothetical protein HG536_0A00530 [Torulaspora globosa]|uniref:rRNA-processing protein EFG1 n=1 Tax=Torulaspora globosa TaxID=48254 RepID=A0A7G3Z9Q0_9SACH|nr:uncharacterized protein HG536_0A00530 [Torulaspora globosa]QLL30236.1 hypothetical protein HG536_0A00530 [Torulaspora globosa]
MAQTQQKRKRARNTANSLEMAQFIDAGSNKIKKRIRDLERLLTRKRDSLPDTIIVEKERTLEALKLELQNAQLRTTIKRNAKKYHMVRFFERKKALRRYKKALKAVEESDGDEKCKQDLIQKSIDLCYVVNFPKAEKYIALYPSDDGANGNKDDTSSMKTEAKRAAFRDLVSKQLKEGTLPVSLDDILSGKKLDKEGAGMTLEAADADKKTDIVETAPEEDEFFE